MSTEKKLTAVGHLKALAQRLQDTRNTVSQLANATTDAIEELTQRVNALTTYIPSVSENGILSWTNDAGKDNPPPVNLADLVIKALTNGDTEKYGNGDTEVYGT